MNVLDRVAVVDHDGRSGSSIERGRLADGTPVYVKRAHVGSPAREGHLLRAGVFDRLPAGVATALLAVDVVDGEVVTVTRDLGSAVLRWDRVLDAAEVGSVFERIGSVHRAFAGAPPPGLCPLEERLVLLAPGAVDLGDLSVAVDRGWELFGDLVPADVADAVAAAQRDPIPLAAAMATGPATLVHGDFFLPNLALAGDELVLLDWTLATAGPPSLDLITFCAGAMSNVAMSRAALVDAARQSCADVVDDRAFAAAELWALLELGWNKALDAVDHPDPAKRATERADLDFWVDRARAVLDAGGLERGVRPARPGRPG